MTDYDRHLHMQDKVVTRLLLALTGVSAINSSDSCVLSLSTPRHDHDHAAGESSMV